MSNVPGDITSATEAGPIRGGVAAWSHLFLHSVLLDLW
jgi:hypothetical protein